jgi:hypothetical protein
MKNPSVGKKLCVVFIAAIIGAALFDALILIDNQAYVMGRHGQFSDYWNDHFAGIGIILFMAPLLVGNTIGSLGGLVNEYTVDGLFGAVIFAFVAIIWQFVVKDAHETKKLNCENSVL